VPVRDNNGKFNKNYNRPYVKVKLTGQLTDTFTVYRNEGFIVSPLTGEETQALFVPVSKLGYNQQGRYIYEYGSDVNPDTQSIIASNRWNKPIDKDIQTIQNMDNYIPYSAGKNYLSIIKDKISPNKKVEISSSLPDSSQKINIYAGSGENVELSNFAIRPFKIDSALIGEEKIGTIEFKSVEQAFQYSKLELVPFTEENVAIANKILKTTNGGELRRLGKQFKGFNNKSWDNTSIYTMKSLIYSSFKQNSNATKALLETGNAILTHTQDKGKWGTEFPRILMEVRNELRSELNALSRGLNEGEAETNC
jgi:ribA/ribD-fused uncharacterized protein